MDEEIIRAKAREMAEMLFGHHGSEKATILEHFLGDIEERVRAFYAENGEYPVFKKHSKGGCVIGTKQEMDRETDNRDPRC